MHYPNPLDSMTNPVRYWTDVALMQMEVARMGWQMACVVNPLLPVGLFAAEVGVERGERTRKPAARKPATRRAPARPVAGKSAPPKAAAPKAAVKKAELATAPAAVRALKMVDFPTFGSPTIPQVNPIS